MTDTEKPKINSLNKAGNVLMIISVITILFTLIISLYLEMPAKVEAYKTKGGDFILTDIRVKEGSVNINTADVNELQQLPGIGEKLAERIVEERNKNGNFCYPEDITAVSGIGEGKLKSIYNMLDLN